MHNFVGLALTAGRSISGSLPLLLVSIANQSICIPSPPRHVAAPGKKYNNSAIWASILAHRNSLYFQVKFIGTYIIDTQIMTRRIPHWAAKEYDIIYLLCIVLLQ